MPRFIAIFSSNPSRLAIAQKLSPRIKICPPDGLLLEVTARFEGTALEKLLRQIHPLKVGGLFHTNHGYSCGSNSIGYRCSSRQGRGFPGIVACPPALPGFTGARLQTSFDFFPVGDPYSRRTGGPAGRSISRPSGTSRIASAENGAGAKTLNLFHPMWKDLILKKVRNWNGHWIHSNHSPLFWEESWNNSVLAFEITDWPFALSILSCDWTTVRSTNGLSTWLPPRVIQNFSFHFCV